MPLQSAASAASVLTVSCGHDPLVCMQLAKCMQPAIAHGFRPMSCIFASTPATLTLPSALRFRSSASALPPAAALPAPIAVSGRSTGAKARCPCRSRPAACCAAVIASSPGSCCLLLPADKWHHRQVYALQRAAPSDIPIQRTSLSSGTEQGTAAGHCCKRVTWRCRPIRGSSPRQPSYVAGSIAVLGNRIDARAASAVARLAHADFWRPCGACVWAICRHVAGHTAGCGQARLLWLS